MLTRDEFNRIAAKFFNYCKYPAVVDCTIEVLSFLKKFLDNNQEF